MTTKDKQKGLVNLMVVFAVGLLSLGAVLITATSAATEAKNAQNNTHSDQAFYTAESGMTEGTYQFINYDLYAGGNAPEIDINTASSPTITLTTNWPYTIIKGASAKISNNRTVIHKLTVFPGGEVFNFATYANAGIDIKNAAPIITGNIFANGNIQNNKNATLNGSGLSTGTIDYPDSFNTTLEGVEPLLPPTLDIAPYFQEASNAGTLYTNTILVENLLNGNTTNGIIALNNPGSEIKLTDSNTILSGSLITNGSLDLNGGTYTATNDHPIFFVKGNLTLRGNTVIKGIIYVEGNVDISGSNNEITGSIISLSSMTINGDTEITYDEDIANDWISFPGWDKTTPADPEVILWNEE